MSSEALPRKLNRFLSTHEVIEITGWSRATLWRQIRANRFPSAIPTSPQRVGWLESEVAEWQEQTIAARDERRERRKNPKQRTKAKKSSKALH